MEQVPGLPFSAKLYEKGGAHVNLNVSAARSGPRPEEKMHERWPAHVEPGRVAARPRSGSPPAVNGSNSGN
ncbi:hypothetical protein [Desulfosarcina alkanivorans]|uniref:hypothetical protein n=1 Tax=Desulfosarcina alkanivorans TaxID=571177 RepID=UPI0012D2D83E|nr:hypothetical protein [Desulfosarcina alkanivorans]